MIFTTKQGTISVTQLNLVMSRHKLTITWNYTQCVSGIKNQAAVELDKEQTRAVASQLHNFIHNRTIIVARHGTTESAVNLIPTTDGRFLGFNIDMNGIGNEHFMYNINKNEAKQLLDYMNANMEQFVFTNSDE